MSHLTIEDVAVGAEAPVVSHTLTRTDLVRYAGASGDYNPMHHDEPKAQKAGMPSVFGHGMLSMAIVGRAVTDYVGVAALREFGVRFTKQTWPDTTYATKVVVTGTREEDGEHLVDLDVALAAEDGTVVVSGSAVAALPSRG